MRKRVLFCSWNFIAYAYHHLPLSHDALLLKKKMVSYCSHIHAQSSIYLCPIIACSIVWECDERFISRAGHKCRKWMQRHAPADACSHAHKRTGLTAKSWCHLSFFTFFFAPPIIKSAFLFLSTHTGQKCMQLSVACLEEHPKMIVYLCRFSPIAGCRDNFSDKIYALSGKHKKRAGMISLIVFYKPDLFMTWVI